MAYEGHFRVWRGDADGGDLQDFDVEVNEGEVVLDIIHRLQATQAPDLAVRWNCKAGKCGSCSAEVNGRPRLMCMTRMSTFEEDETITVSPLAAFPPIRDLVTDVSFNYAKAREVPAFHPPDHLEPGDYRMAQVDVERSQEFRKCIECFLCQNTCHVIRDHGENKDAFSGPRMFIRIAELDMHPLDTLDRKRDAHGEHGISMCNITKCCTEVCPENIKITDNAIIPMKERVVDVKWDPWIRFLHALPSRHGWAASSALRRGDAAEAEASAKQRLAVASTDPSALAALATSQLVQGRFMDAARSARRGVKATGPRSNAHMRFCADQAWALLCAAEAGEIPYEHVSDEARGALAEAQRLASTGAVLTRIHALAAYLDGDPEQAIEVSLEGLAWHPPAAEQSDAWLTIAEARHVMGQPEAAAEALRTGSHLNVSNPRTPGVTARVSS
ncbi:MAG: succinate dehydrogenase/fumarate reductase iron-sulfur subunit [Actinomycetota bacterium]|nr:succinate dehydrogenase/fumarate reductase iron-sulfur subunit [Actinomycetota bacterium]MDH4353644.1 succinate dehydrogenase/fumarate reductase iron-sulfur subunit [Actinomycetota bacterium]MDH5278185.1 succinate dehydrogenase/fumarate reductase iron-sulfur subunit [Actinomycetota bacterium]